MQEVLLRVLFRTAAIRTYIYDNPTIELQQSSIELFTINSAIILRYFNKILIIIIIISHNYIGSMIYNICT